MQSIPWGSIVLVVLVDSVLVIGASAFVGYLLAVAIDRPLRLGILIGAALPFVGPLVWAARARWAGTLVAQPRAILDSRLRWALGVGLASSALAYLVATVLPWAGAEGNVKGYSILEEVSPLDSAVGAVALVVGALVLVGCAVSLIWTSSWCASALVVVLSGFWLATTIDTLVVSSAVNHVAETVAGLAGGVGEAHLSTGSGTWTVLAASVVVLAGGLVLGTFGTRMTALPPDVAAYPSMIYPDLDYGDGF
jgi:hypothetical protein